MCFNPIKLLIRTEENRLIPGIDELDEEQGACKRTRHVDGYRSFKLFPFFQVFLLD